MLRFGVRDTKCSVTLYARVWIEMSSMAGIQYDWLSLSTRGCGLKSKSKIKLARETVVTLYARVWIEIITSAE